MFKTIFKIYFLLLCWEVLEIQLKLFSSAHDVFTMPELCTKVMILKNWILSMSNHVGVKIPKFPNLTLLQMFYSFIVPGNWSYTKTVRSLRKITLLLLTVLREKSKYINWINGYERAIPRWDLFLGLLQRKYGIM